MKRTAVVLAVVFMIAWAIPAVSSDVALSFMPTSTVVPLGTPVNVMVQADPGLNTIGNYDFAVTYDPSIVHLAVVSWYGLDHLGASIRDATFGPGIVYMFESSFETPGDLVTLQSGASKPFGLFVLSFNTVGLGTTALNFVPTSGGGYPLIVGDEMGNPYNNVTSTAGSITVTGDAAVPEPASVLLLGCGTLAFLLRRKR